MPVALYARVSTERQERQQTIDSQLAALRAWAVAQGHPVSDEQVFRDEGYSGSRLDRPGLDALRDAVRDGIVSTLVVLAPDRLARKYAYQVLLLEEFRRAGAEVVFLQHPISDDPDDQLLLQIQGAIAEYERAVLGERFRRGKLQKARDGHYIAARAPYGYRYVPRRDAVPGRITVDEQEAELVRRVYGWFTDEQTTIRQVVKRLNAGPDRPRSGRPAWPPCLGAYHDPSHPGRPDLHRHRLCQPLRLRGADQAVHPTRPTHGRRDPALPQAARAVDRHSGAGAGRPRDVGPGAGPTRAQRSTLVPQQHPAQLPAALPAQMRALRAGHVWHHPPRVGAKAGAASLPMPRQGLRRDGANQHLPQSPHQCRRDRAGRVGPCHGPAGRPGPAPGAVRPLRRRRRCRLRPGASRRAAAACPAGPDRTRRQAPAGRLPGWRSQSVRTVRASPASRARA